MYTVVSTFARPVHGRVHGLYIRPCTRVHGPYTAVTRPYTRVHDRVLGHMYGPSAQPLHGPVHWPYTCAQPCTRPHTGRVHVNVYLSTTVYRVHGRVQAVSTAVYTDHVNARVQDRVHGRVQAVYTCTRPCTWLCRRQCTGPSIRPC